MNYDANKAPLGISPHLTRTAALNMMQENWQRVPF